jgi:hypothetical protein
VADTVVQIVKVMDGLNRYRFESAGAVGGLGEREQRGRGPQVGGEAGAGPNAGRNAPGGEVRPAA